MNLPAIAAPLNAALLIAEVHARRPLWDKRHELHNQRDLVDALWTEVAVVTGVPGRPKEIITPEMVNKINGMIIDDRRVTKREIAEAAGISTERVLNILHEYLGITEALCQMGVAGKIPIFLVPRIRAKWKNLKDSFRREAKRAFTEINYRPRWRLYQPLMFLYDQQMEFDVKDEDRNSLHSTYLEPDQTNSKYDCEYDPLGSENGSRTNGPSYKTEYCVPEGYFHQGRTNDLHSEDADMCFFRSLLPHMKELTPQKRMQLRIKIHEMVYREVYSDKNDTNSVEIQDKK